MTNMLFDANKIIIDDTGYSQGRMLTAEGLTECGQVMLVFKDVSILGGAATSVTNGTLTGNTGTGNSLTNTTLIGATDFQGSVDFTGVSITGLPVDIMNSITAGTVSNSTGDSNSFSNTTLTGITDFQGTIDFTGTNVTGLPLGTSYTAGANITIDGSNVISAVDTTYTAGAGIQILNDVISATGSVVPGSADMAYTFTQPNHGFVSLDWLRFDKATGLFVKALSDNLNNVGGRHVVEIVDQNTFRAAKEGTFAIPNSLAIGEYYLSKTSAGGYYNNPNRQDIWYPGMEVISNNLINFYSGFKKQPSRIIDTTDKIYWTVQGYPLFPSFGNMDYISMANGNIFIGSISYNNYVVVGESIDYDTYSFVARDAGDFGYNSGGVVKVVYGNGKYVALHNNGNVGVSTDMITWTTYSTGAGTSVADIIFNNGQYYVINTVGSIYRSDNGTSWSNINNIGTTGVRRIFAMAGRFFVVGSSGAYETAYPMGDATTTFTRYDTDDIVGGGLGESLVLVSSTGVLKVYERSFTSYSFTSTPYSGINDVSFSNGVYMTSGSSPMQYASLDGKVWTMAPSTFDTIERQTNGAVAASSNGNFVGLQNKNAYLYHSRVVGTNYTMSFI